MFGFIKIAAAVPALSVGNVSFNKEKIKEQIIKAKSLGADITVFPELCITGFTCGDLFMQQTLLKESLKAIKFATKARTKKRIAKYFVSLAIVASKVRALFFERKVSAPPEITPFIPARRPC